MAAVKGIVRHRIRRGPVERLIRSADLSCFSGFGNSDEEVSSALAFGQSVLHNQADTIFEPSAF